MSANIQTSEIAEFFKQKSVFITGATGFIGKQLVEKLIRSCPDIENIYVLVRPKRGKNIDDRIKDLISSHLFDTVRNVNPNFDQKIIALHGDILDPNFGLNSADESLLIENCHVVFHSAATIRFNEPLRLALQMNVGSVQKLLTLCHKMQKLQAVVHVSTAYANCNRKDIAEIIYPAPIHPMKLLNASEWMDDQVFDVLTKKIIQDRPNTYTYTKALAEYLISQEAKDLPLAIIRPSVVGASWHEPVPGWVDNYNGATGLLVAAGKGMLRTMIGNPTAIADVVPVDVCVNMMIAIAWHTAMNKSNNIPVYHCCTGHLGTLTWGQTASLCKIHFDKICLENTIMVPHLELTEYQFRYHYLRFLREIIPAFILDCYMKLIGRKAIFLKISDKINKSVRTLDFFTTYSWNFSVHNGILLENDMSDIDRQIFYFNVNKLDWFQYFHSYCMGAKQYLLREDLAKIPKCYRHNQRLKRLYNFLWFTTVGLVLKFIFFRSIKFRRIIFILLRFFLTKFWTIIRKMLFYRK